MHRLLCLLAALAGGCATRASLGPAEAARIHGKCRELSEGGRALTRRTRDLGHLPRGRGTTERVVIYGASWCEACRFAADYLVHLGIPYVELDVEADPSADAERAEVLAEAALGGRRGLPVVETRGTVMLGFMPCVVEAAWRDERRP